MLSAPLSLFSGSVVTSVRVFFFACEAELGAFMTHGTLDTPFIAHRRTAHVTPCLLALLGSQLQTLQEGT